MKWLLLRGLARDARHWGDFPDILKNHLNNAEVFVLDLPGFGTESHRISPFTIRGITNDIRKRWAQLEKKHPGTWNILSISLGGMIALDWINRFSSDF